MQHSVFSLGRSGAIVIITLLLALLAQAQQGGSPAPARGGRTDTLQLELRRKYEREAIERALAQPPAHERRNTTISVTEFQNDFLKLQVVNNRLLKSTAVVTSLDLNFIARSAGEIRKIGQRLRANRVLPKSLAGAQPARVEIADGAEQLRSSLATLDKLVVEFVSNPVFESAKVVDAQLAAKARLDLEQIIHLSVALKKSCEQLKSN